jgi:predicted metalloprotease with PDZ domain
VDGRPVRAQGIASLAGTAAQESPLAEPIRYHVDLSDRLHHLVRVTLTVPADLGDGARLVLPVWTPGSYVVRDYVHHVQWITATDADGEEVPLAPDGRTAWRLPTGTDGPVTVTLELYANRLTVRTNHVDDHHALLIPAATFPYVDGGTDRPHVVHLPPQPADHRVWSLLPPGSEPDTFVAEHRDHLVDSAFEVGDLPAIDLEVAGVPHTFVWAGHGGAPDLRMVAADIRRIAEATIALFGDGLPVDHYTFLAVGWDQGGGGLEHRDGAVLQVPVHSFQDEDLTARFQSLVAHEYLHLWNVKRLVPAALTAPDYERATHTPSLWVAEGWTAYYDELLPVRAGVWSPRRHLDTLRDGWQRLQDLPGARLQSLRQASHEAWVKHYVRDENTPNVMTDYYGHGALVAWELDLLLRARQPDGDGLDAVLRTLWRAHAGRPEGYTEHDVLAAIAAAGGDDLAALADQRVSRPQLPELGQVVGTVGLRWVPDGAPEAPDLGVQVAGYDQGVRLATVLRDRPAWRGGLTGGDRLVAIGGRTIARGQLPAVLRAHQPGDTVEVAVTRGPRLLTLPVTLGTPRQGVRLVPVDGPTAAQRTAYHRWTGRTLEEV